MITPIITSKAHGMTYFNVERGRDEWTLDTIDANFQELVMQNLELQKRINALEQRNTCTTPVQDSRIEII